MAWTVTVVEIASGNEHHLPADTVTRDLPSPSLGVPLIPLAYRPLGPVFYVSGARWAQLAGKAVRVAALSPRIGRRPMRPVEARLP